VRPSRRSTADFSGERESILPRLTVLSGKAHGVAAPCRAAIVFLLLDGAGDLHGSRRGAAMENDRIPGEIGKMRLGEEGFMIEQAGTLRGSGYSGASAVYVAAWDFTRHASTPLAHNVMRGLTATTSNSGLLWLGGAAIALAAMFVIYVGVVLVAALKADTPELQQYRSGLLRELLRFLRDMCRRGKR
jgi:hypothetical protein